MKTREGIHSKRFHRAVSLVIIAACLSVFATASNAAIFIPGSGSTNTPPSYTSLDSWSFQDSTNWTSDKGSVSVFTNLGFTHIGNGSSLIVDTNLPASLQFNVVDTNNVTNFSASVGSVSFWFASGSWSSASAGGSGPGEYARLFEVGAYTPDSSYGWFSLYVDPAGDNLYFSTQTNDLSSTETTYLSAPISWATNYFHNVVLTYSSTNTLLYLDGALVASGPGLTIYPGTNTSTLNIGSDATGVYQSHGLFNDVVTYGVPLDAGTIQQFFTSGYNYYMINPVNRAMAFASAATAMVSYSPGNDVFTGSGNLTISPTLSSIQISSTNPYIVWMTNVAASASSGKTTITFTVEGGQPGYFYDVFVTSTLASPLTNALWSWQGQAQQFQICTLTNIPNATFLIMLGTPQDSDGDGLTDAYERLVSHTNPYVYSTDATGTADGWEIFYFGYTGVNPNDDPDQDGLTNYQEFMGGTNPLIKDNYKAPLNEPKINLNLP